MKFEALATDYDGTIAHEGRVDEATLSALQRAKRSGLRLLLVTGRELTDLLNTFPDVGIFDLVIAENGALLFNPATKSVKLLATPPPPALLEWLTSRNVPISVGHSIVATIEPYEHEALEAIRQLGLEWHIAFNKGAVMLLPSGVTKATGLKPALEELSVESSRTIGVGDAENDQAFLEACGLAIAVCNALESVKKNADMVTNRTNGAGVAELIERWMNGELASIERRTRSG